MCFLSCGVDVLYFGLASVFDDCLMIVYSMGSAVLFIVG